jgi:hypothetical protein
MKGEQYIYLFFHESRPGVDVHAVEIVLQSLKNFFVWPACLNLKADELLSGLLA